MGPERVGREAETARWDMRGPCERVSWTSSTITANLQARLHDVLEKSPETLTKLNTAIQTGAQRWGREKGGSDPAPSGRHRPRRGLRGYTPSSAAGAVAPAEIYLRKAALQGAADAIASVGHVAPLGDRVSSQPTPLRDALFLNNPYPDAHGAVVARNLLTRWGVDAGAIVFVAGPIPRKQLR